MACHQALAATGATGSAGTTPSGTPATSSPTDGATQDTGLPPEPTGADRAAVLAVLFDVGGGKLISDEDKAVGAARDQCAALDGGAANPDHAAAQRFSYNGVTLTDDQGKHIDIGLRKTLCPAS